MVFKPVYINFNDNYMKGFSGWDLADNEVNLQKE